VKLTTHLHLVSRSKNAWNCTFTPLIHFHGVVQDKCGSSLITRFAMFVTSSMLQSKQITEMNECSLTKMERCHED
jgi:hypothetical protein